MKKGFKMKDKKEGTTPKWCFPLQVQKGFNYKTNENNINFREKNEFVTENLYIKQM